MNKKGLILLALFVVSSLGIVAVSQATTNDKALIHIYLKPAFYVSKGHLWIELNKTMLPDGAVLGENDSITFSFDYDVALVSWGSDGIYAYGGGFQPDYWYYNKPNPDGTYNETRVCGTINVYLDQYDLGMSNFAPDDGDNTTQTIAITLTKGWHYLTVLAAELVSDSYHTRWYWQFVKDQVSFYVGEKSTDTPTKIEDSDAVCSFNITAVRSENLVQHHYNWTDIGVIQPIAEPASYGSLTQNTTYNGVVKANIIYNTSWSPLLNLTEGRYGAAMFDMYNMGPSTYLWFVNNGSYTAIQSQYAVNTQKEVSLKKGYNFVYFVLLGIKSDGWGAVYGNPYPMALASNVIYTIFVSGELSTTAGYGFVAFISVSILSIAAVLTFRKKRK